MFPQFVPPADYQTFVRELLTARNNALATMMTPGRSLLAISNRLDSKVPDSDGQPTQCGPRTESTLSNPAVRPRAVEDPLTTDFQIWLTDNIQCQVGQLQVFAARLVRFDNEIEVILKLFQQSLLPIPEVHDVLGDETGWMSAIDIAKKEAWAYTRLLPLQGTVVPHSYGFYLFQHSNGEKVIGHIMEKIEGKELTMTYLKDRIQTADDLRKLADAIAFALDLIHSNGVLHGDVQGRNIHSIDDLSSVVIYDFDHAQTPDNDNLAWDGSNIGDIFGQDYTTECWAYDWHIDRKDHWKCLKSVVVVKPVEMDKDEE